MGRELGARLAWRVVGWGPRLGPGRLTYLVFSILALTGLLFMGASPSAHSSGAPDALAPVAVVSPQAGATLGNGNLALIELTTSTPLDGVTSWVEVATDDSADWTAASPVPGDPTRWRFVWADPAPGRHQARVRAMGPDQGPVVERSLTFTFDPDRRGSLSIDNPYAHAGRFCKGQLHVHSTYSFDGWTSLPPDQLARAYQRLGYHFLAITDHDVVAYPKEVNGDQFVVVPAFESTSDSGHITGLFTQTVVSPALGPQARLDAIREAGGLAILNHPSWRVGWEGTDFTRLRDYFAIEIFNAMTADTAARIDRNLRLWHQVLKANGRALPIWGVAVDDAHAPNWMNVGWVMAKMPRIDAEAVREALTRGAFYSSTGPTFSTLGVLDGAIAAASPNASVIRFIDQDLRVVAEGDPALATYRPGPDDLFIRVEAVDAAGLTAWSQPFFMK